VLKIKLCDLKNKVAIVTGGSRGIGRAIAYALAKNGTNVVINYIKNRDKAKEVAKEIKDLGQDAIIVQADISKWIDCKHLVNEAISAFDRIDILINNAGITTMKSIVNMTIEEWNRIIAVNLSGAFYCARAVAKYMVEKKWGRIINITSIGGIFGFPEESAYSASKAGLIGLTKSLAKELTPYGILVNAIAPSCVETDMVSSLPDDLKARMIIPPIGRFSRAEEIADVVVFLCRQTYISGETIMVAGAL